MSYGFYAEFHFRHSIYNTYPYNIGTKLATYARVNSKSILRQPMSALRKQTTLKWKHVNELTPGGRIVATNWTASVGKFALSVTNWPGTSTLDWEITVPGTDWRSGGAESRYEYTVATLKDMVCRKAEGLVNTIGTINTK